MKRTFLLTAAILAALSAAAQWQPAGDRIKTVWGENLDPQNVLPEYPRPQLVRGEWQNLNGLWNYAIRPLGETPEEFDGEILVPFAAESAGSPAPRTASGTNGPSPFRGNGTANGCCCTSAPWTGRPTSG